MSNIEKPTSNESEESQEEWKPSRVELYFFRHGSKEKDPEKLDEHIRLTEAGRKEAVAKGKTIETKPQQAVAFGSPRERTHETAALVMVGGEDEITGDETLEELHEKLDTSLTQVGKGTSKIAVDKRLNFVLDKKNPTQLGKELVKAFKEGRYLGFTIEESDERARATGDTETFTYSRGAADVAEIIEKYVRVADRWNDIVQKGKYDSETLQRFLGSHLGVGESFLAKLVDKMKGREERDKLVHEALRDLGFNTTDGFEVEILKASEHKDPKVRVMYHAEDQEGNTIFEFNEEVPFEIIQEIIDERV